MNWLKRIFCRSNINSRYIDTVTCTKTVDSTFLVGKVLVIKFKGHYPDGSAGSVVAQRMRNFSEASLRESQPVCVLFDLSEFHYDWGDNVGIAWFDDEDLIPTALVVGAFCEQALRSLFFGLDSRKEITDAIGVFRDEVSARKYLLQLISS